MKWVAAIPLLLVLGCTTVTPQKEAEVNKDGSGPLFMPSNMQCFPYRVMAKVLFDQYRETQTAAGVLTTGQGKYIANLFKSERGTWTMVITNPELVSCILGYGTSWAAAKPPEGA